MTQVLVRPSRVTAATLAVALTVVVAGAALAQAGLALIIQQMQLDESGLTQVTVQVTGLPPDTELDDGSFSVTENGRAITDLSVAAGGQDQYVLQFMGIAATPQVELAVTVSADGQQATSTLSADNPRAVDVVDEPEPFVVPGAGFFGSPIALGLALLAGFLAIVLLALVLFVPSTDRQVMRTLTDAVRRPEQRRRSGESMTARSVGEGAAALISRVPRPKGYDERQQARIDRAGWNLRATEFTGLRVAAVVAGVVVGWGLLLSIPVAVIAAVTAWILPNILLTQRIAARQAKFLSQLPDTLQLMAGALRAGYGILQAIDTVVRETGDPMSTEFQRVLTEARLGLPLEDSLQAMAERIDSDDFRWVAVAINIQRRVGGNLADLLETVSNTLREREMVRRQIQVLSAEGRLSAVILTLLPLFLGLYMFVVSREYIGVMFERTIGWIMLGGAAALMVLGVLWMRKLVAIDV